jgi:ribosome-associated protein
MSERPDEFDDQEDLPSKSELKRQSRDLQDLGWALVELPESDLEAIPLPDDVREAVDTGRRITAGGAKARHRLFIGKLLRRIDVEPIRTALERRSETDRQRVQREKSIERWRDRLLADEADAWTELAVLVGPAALQPMRSLVRQARAEREAARAPAAARQLFRRLRDALSPGE